MVNCLGNGGRDPKPPLRWYDIAFTHDVLQIGCKRYPIKDWFEFDDEAISSMDGGALEWWAGGGQSWADREVYDDTPG